MMPSLEHGKLLASKFHMGLIKELQVLMVIFIKNIFFFYWFLHLEDLFDFENIYYERKVKLALYKLSEYALHW